MSSRLIKVRLDSGNLAVYDTADRYSCPFDARRYGHHVATKFGDGWLAGSSWIKSDRAEHFDALILTSGPCGNVACGSCSPKCGLCARIGTNDLEGPRAHSPGCSKGDS